MTETITFDGGKYTVINDHGLLRAERYGEPWPAMTDDLVGNHLVAAMFNEVLVQRQLVERLRQEAQIHAQEARTANATIAEIYQLVTGATGEPGNWNGARPVRELLDRYRNALQAAHNGLKWYRDAAPDLVDGSDDEMDAEIEELLK